MTSLNKQGKRSVVSNISRSKVYSSYSGNRLEVAFFGFKVDNSFVDRVQILAFNDDS